jgi:hypothetical protein
MKHAVKEMKLVFYFHLQIFFGNIFRSLVLDGDGDQLHASAALPPEKKELPVPIV